MSANTATKKPVAKTVAPLPPLPISNHGKMQLDQFLTKFQLGETLGTGAFSEVKVGIDRKTQTKYAIKIIDKAKCKGKEGMIETEINILKTVNHEHIIKLYEMYEVDNNIYLVMELVTGGELFDDIVKKGTYTESATAKVIHKILTAIEYLHLKGIAHRDLKPENLLLANKSSNAKIMISDFGLSKIFDDNEVMKTACGTPGYVAPEVLKRQGYGREVDLWSIGVITYILLCGYPPFYDKHNVELFKQIMAGKYEFDSPWWDNISEKAKNLIRNLLVLDTKARFTARMALDHPFIVDHCGLTPPPVLDAPPSCSSSPRVSLTDKPSRPIGDRTTMDDSGVVASMNNLAIQEDHTGSESESEKLSTSQDPVAVRFLTYNIFLRPPGIRNNSSDHKSARQTYFGENILPAGNYDIVALQEMFSYGSSRQAKMVGFAKKNGFEYYVSSPSKGILNAQVDGGLMILSKYPIVRTEKLTFKRGVAIDRFSAKGAIYAKICIRPHQHIHVFTTHLQSSPCDKRVEITDPTVAVRLQQISLLKEFIDECTRDKPTSEPIVLLGDLNTNGRASTDNGINHSLEYTWVKKILEGEGLYTTSGFVIPATLSLTKIKYNVKDLAYEAYGEHPITYGDVMDLITKRPRETVLTAVDDWAACCCLDYIFLMTNNGEEEKKIAKTRVVRFEVGGGPFTQVSDHYGVTTQLLF